jgi:hypothetical protein
MDLQLPLRQALKLDFSTQQCLMATRFPERAASDTTEQHLALAKPQRELVQGPGQATQMALVHQGILQERHQLSLQFQRWRPEKAHHRQASHSHGTNHQQHLAIHQVLIKDHFAMWSPFLDPPSH